MEEWRDIPGLEGLYQASSEGRIRSLPRRVPTNNGSRMSPGKTLAPPLSDSGYLTVRVSVLGRYATHGVHRLVCAAFHGPGEDGYQVAHADGDRTNNRPGNLRWATPKENSQERRRHGTQTIGTRVNTNKLNEADVLEIRRRAAAGERTMALAQEFGVHRSSVNQMIARRTWTHI